MPDVGTKTTEEKGSKEGERRCVVWCDVVKKRAVPCGAPQTRFLAFMSGAWRLKLGRQDVISIHEPAIVTFEWRVLLRAWNYTRCIPSLI